MNKLVSSEHEFYEEHPDLGCLSVILYIDYDKKSWSIQDHHEEGIVTGKTNIEADMIRLQLAMEAMEFVDNQFNPKPKGERRFLDKISEVPPSSATHYSDTHAMRMWYKYDKGKLHFYNNIYEDWVMSNMTTAAEIEKLKLVEIKYA